MDLFRRKSVRTLIDNSRQSKGLRRELKVWDLTLLGIGAIIGTGIFVLTGTGALKAGPGLMLSFVIAGLACAFSALAYAEFASTVPVSGSVYTYSYVTLGELAAWIIGWDLVLEYMLAVSAVSSGWSGYFQSLLGGFGLNLPDALRAAPGAIPGKTTLFNLPAFLIVMLITLLLSRGIKESKRVNNVMVLVKIGVILLFVLIGVFYIKPANWQPFAPFGAKGIFAAAAIVFFTYLGFDAVSAAAEEARDPARTLPRGLLYSLGICTMLYMVVSAIMTGIVRYPLFKGHEDHPVSLALQIAGQKWFAAFIDIGAIVGMTTVMLVALYAQTRVAFAMSRDGLLPKWFSRVHEKYRTPYNVTWVLGIVAGLIGALVPIRQIAELVNIGTLFAFIIVSISVIVLRKSQPNLPRGFRCPAVPFVPAVSIVLCAFLMSQLMWITWAAFLIWLTIGLIIYFTYSRKHSALNASKAQ
ncbi:putative amino acid permease YhdG [Polycladomyces abyssicola]|uniref:Putative amino acid permease YhdG n=1 Tax=Polycladomyces abyssicola TaxID=1125966 RepID=A0A8D5UDV3_9BACL|nr:amino acid permease [Polycladomyces abyssicola]BCU80893.1 putative amino acid permease YhdG [Polycladomyces abyssicola]